MPKRSSKRSQKRDRAIEIRRKAILALYEKGEHLHRTQLEEIADLIPERKWVAHMTELAGRLMIERRTLYRMMKRENHPGASDNGCYDVERWRAWLEPRRRFRGGQGGTLAILVNRPPGLILEGRAKLESDLLDLRIERAESELKIMRFKFAVKREEYVLKSEVNSDRAKLAERLIWEIGWRLRNAPHDIACQGGDEQAIRKVLFPHLEELSGIIYRALRPLDGPQSL